MERNYHERCYIAFYHTLNNIFKQSKKPIAPIRLACVIF